ncbi:MAG: hypothetical protein Q7T33_10205 [Dehalococcoidia bacterium]|nr:hypothetical protein [Dehalococcoidia bacterium]
MTNAICLADTIPDAYTDPVGYYSAVSELMRQGRIAWGPILIPTIPVAQGARGLTAKQAAPQYRYRVVAAESVPHGVRVSAGLGLRAAARDLKLTKYTRLLFFAEAAAGERERFATQTPALAYTQMTGQWADVFVNVEQSNTEACMSAIHETWHVSRDGRWRGRPERSPRESAAEEAAADAFMYSLMSRTGLWAVRGLR